MFKSLVIVNRIPAISMLICMILISALSSNAQSDKKYIRQGNKEYEKNNYSESEVSYRKAIDKNKQSPDPVFNTGTALYKQNKFEDAGKQFIENTNMNEDKVKKSASLYNLGNSLFMAKKLKESIEAYKSSLKLNPGNMEAKYNLAYAQDLLKQQEQQQQDKNNQDQDKDKDKDKDKNKNKDESKKDKQDQNEKDQQKDQQQQKQQQKQEQQQSISKEDAQRILDALANDEKNVQEKVKLAKAKSDKVRTVKNW